MPRYSRLTSGASCVLLCWIRRKQLNSYLGGRESGRGTTLDQAMHLIAERGLPVCPQVAQTRLRRRARRQLLPRRQPRNGSEEEEGKLCVVGNHRRDISVDAVVAPLWGQGMRGPMMNGSPRACPPDRSTGA
jgi:hypothetical protein